MWRDKLKDYVIYTAGGMSKFGVDNFDKSNEWRKYCKNALENYDDRKYRVIVINPNDYYNMLDSSTYDSEKEIVEFEQEGRVRATYSLHTQLGVHRRPKIQYIETLINKD